MGNELTSQIVAFIEACGLLVAACILSLMLLGKNDLIYDTIKPIVHEETELVCDLKDSRKRHVCALQDLEHKE